MSEAPWSDIKGKPLNDRGLAVRLRQYSVKSKTLRIGSGTSKGYARADLWDAWESYLPSVGARSVTSVTTVTSPGLRGPDVTDVSDNVTDVTASNGAGKADELGSVADVTLVTDLAEDRRASRVCAQCGSGNGDLDHQADGNRLVWLHRECARFWARRSRAV